MPKIGFALLFLSIALSACLKQDKPITLPPKGNGDILQLNMGENYDTQYFVSLRTNQIVHTSAIAAWDIAFQCGEQQHGVLLNGGKGMAAFPITNKSFQSLSYADTAGLGSLWRIDYPCGQLDSLVMGYWPTTKPVYWIRRDKLGKTLAKVQILNVDALSYTFRFGMANDTGKLYTIAKNPNVNVVYFSFDQAKEVNDIEPPKTTWDFVSTLYSCTFYDQNPALPYVVNGILLNPNNTKAYRDSLLGYNNIDAVRATSFPLSSAWDAIGYSWKSYDLNTNIYTAQSRYTYIVQTQNNALFKLRFLDFYSPQGIKGSPKFEFKPL